MDTDELTSVFAEATEYVIKTMAFIEVKPHEVLIRTGKDLVGDVSGIIGLTSADKNYSLAVTFSKRAALKVFAAMMGDEPEEITPDVGDAVGELTNIICGQARMNTSQKGLNLSASIPMVVIGENMSIHPVGATSSVIPYDIEGDMFYVEISIEG